MIRAALCRDGLRPWRRKIRSGILALGGLAGLIAVTATASAAATQPPTGRESPNTAPATKSEIATIIETKVICREPGKYPGQGAEYGVNKDGHPVALKRADEPDRYLGWPTIARTRDGELIVAFSGDRDAHICPWGKTQIIRSRDQGTTWSQPQTITSTPLDDRDAGVIQTQAGTLLVSWFTSLAFERPSVVQRYARHAEKLTPEIREQWLGNWVRRSEDGGKSWQQPIRTVSTAPHGPIQLRDGRLLYVGTGTGLAPQALTVEQSVDDGRTWSVMATIPTNGQGPAGSNLNEPHVVELASGKLLAMVRKEPKDRQECILQQSESADGGKSWTPLHSSGIWGFPPHLIQLDNGWVVVSYGHRRKPFGEYACISRDEGKTWDIENRIMLAGAPGPDLGYPSSVQLEDGSILTVYYQADKLGAPTCLMSTRWRLK